MNDITFRFRARLLLFLMTLLILTKSTFATDIASTALFGEETRKLDLTPHIEILVDPDHSLDLEDVSDLEKPYAFKPVSEIGNSFGFSKAVYWVRFSLEVSESSTDTLLLEFKYPLLDDVTLFIPDGKGSFSIRKTGDALPFSMREIKYRNYLFELPPHAGERRDYYMRLESEGSIQIPLSLWRSGPFLEHVDNANFVLGGYYGMMMLLILTALMAFVKIRDRLFIYYAFYLFSFVLFQLSLNGLSYQYLWPDSPLITSRATAALIGLVVLGGLLFSGSFLQIWTRRYFYIRGLFFMLMGSAVIAMFISLFGDYAFAVKMATISGLLLPPLVLIAAILSWRSGYRPARYLLAAWGIFLIGIFIAGLLYLGFLPSTFTTTYSMQIGSTFEVLLLGYAMLARINSLRDEKEQAVVNANKYLHQLNEELESLVDERTKELREKNRQLQIDQAKQLRLAQQSQMIQQIHDSVITTDLKGKIISWNAGSKRLLGYTAGEMIGRDITDIYLEEDYESLKKNIDILMKTGSNHTNIRLVKKSKDVLFAELSLSILRDEENEPVGMIGYAQDITQRVHAEEKVKEQEEIMIAQSRHAAMGEMIGMIAHQWRQPLTVISMGANNILLGVELQDIDDDALKRRAQKIIDQTQHLSKTIDDFRNFFRPDKELEEVRLEDVMKEAEKIIGKNLKNHQITLAIKSDSTQKLKTYSRELLQVYINLLKNAKEAFTDDIREDARIDVIISDDDDHIITTVCDNAGGIDEAIMSKIFDPYFSTKDKQVGTGLGLYMSKTIIEKHLHGVLEVYNTTTQDKSSAEHHGGACFKISLPILQSP